MASEPKEDGSMSRKRHKPEESVAKLRQVDVLVAQGTPVADAIRNRGDRGDVLSLAAGVRRAQVRSGQAHEGAGDREPAPQEGHRGKAKLKKVSPHMLRHSAAVRMAEDGVPMEEIASYLGHGDVNVTRKVYARFSPDHLRGAAAALELDDLDDEVRFDGPERTSQEEAKRLISMVGATG